MGQIDLFHDNIPVSDNQKLSQRGIAEGALLFFAVNQRQVSKPKKGLGIADMIKTFDKKAKGINEEGYEFNHRKV